MSVSIGLCSTAHPHYEAYAPVLADMDDVDFVGVTDEDAERGRAAAAELGCAYRPADELLTAADGVVVCSTNADHGRWIERAAEHGTDVLSEKPLATEYETARDIVETAADAGINLGVAMPVRFSEPIEEVAAALESGRLGRLHAISGTNRGKMPGGWFVDPNAAGGGAIVDHTAHVVDAVQALTGERVVEVYAESGTRFHDIPVEDVNLLSMRLRDGTQFTLDGSWSRPEKWPAWGGVTLDLVGTEGAVAVDCFAQTLDYVGSRGETDVEEAFWGADANEALLDDFVDSVRRDITPEVSGEAALHAVAVIEAAYKSVETGEPVAVDSGTQ